MLQSYLFYLYWNHHIWKFRFRHQNHLLIAIRTEFMTHYNIPSSTFTTFHIIMVCHAVQCVYLIPWPRKYRFRPQNHDPTWSNFQDIGNLRFWGGHFEKWMKLVVSPMVFFLVTSLIGFLRVPWTKWYHSWRIMDHIHILHILFYYDILYIITRGVVKLVPICHGTEGEIKRTYNQVHLRQILPQKAFSNSQDSFIVRVQ